MLALQTIATWTWSADLTVGAATETYTNAADAADCVTSVAALVAWANAGARAWFGTRTFAWTWARNPMTGAAKLTLSATGGVFSITAGSAATLGFGAAAGVTSVTGADADGTWAPALPVSLKRNVRLLGAGDACGAGAVRPGVPGLAHRLPQVEAVGTATDAARLSAMLARSSTPRRAQVWQLHTGQWVEVALGEVSRSPAGACNYRFALDAAGDAV